MNRWYWRCAFIALASLWPLVGSTHAQESDRSIEVSRLWKTFSVTNFLGEEF